MTELVLDSFAYLAYLLGEVGAAAVDELLRTTRDRDGRVAMCAVNVGEVYYRMWRLGGAEAATQACEGLRALGIEVVPPDERMGSTDMGNVTQVVPGLHPSIAIGPEDMGGHTAEFCEAARSPAGHEGLIKAAKLMAMTAVDLLADPVNLVEVRRAFEKQKEQQGG